MGIADTVQFTLRPKDIEKASSLFGIEQALLERLNSQRLLNTAYIRSILIRADYERLTSGLHWLEHQDQRYNFPEVIGALRREYKIPTASIKKILHGRNESLLFCTKCGIKISRSCYGRTNGLCSNCFAESLEL